MPVALVTGGGRGVGREVVRRLAQDGHVVGVTARTVDEVDETVRLVEASGGAAAALPADATDPLAVDRVCRLAEEWLGPVDVLVNNAGTAGVRHGFLDQAAEEWWQVVTTNLLGPALFTRRLVPGMVARRRGHVVTVTSLGVAGPVPGFSACSVAEAGLSRLSDTLAGEVAGAGVTVVDLVAGPVHPTETGPHDRWAEELPPGTPQPAQVAATVSRLVSGRFDALHGCLVLPTDDLDDLVGVVQASGADVRRLRVVVEPGLHIHSA